MGVGTAKFFSTAPSNRSVPSKHDIANEEVFSPPLPPEVDEKHLLGIADTSLTTINAILNHAKHFVCEDKTAQQKLSRLKGKTQINLFFEASTRTQSSFELAGKRLGADVVNMAVNRSSTAKGETLIDTAVTLGAMRPNAIVIRHDAAGAISLIARKLDCAVINAGDGAHEHPSQALLDALSIIQKKGQISGLKIAICGDILHSRVARSNILLLTRLGAQVNLVAPLTLLPHYLSDWPVNVFHSMSEGIADADVVIMLRLQSERMQQWMIPSSEEYYHFFGLNLEKLAYAKPNAMVMHPGPVNRGVEIDSSVVDDIRFSAVRKQVSNGVAVRMALLDIFLSNLN